MRKQQKTNRFLPQNFYYNGVNVEYNRTHCTGECYDICRCTRIINSNIADIDYDYLFHQVIYKFKKYDVENLEYFIDRILLHNGILDSSNYSINIGGGYYGEELDGVSFDKASIVENYFSDLLSNGHLNQQIELVLKMEYGFILNSLLNKSWSQVEINKSSVRVSQETYSQKLDPTKLVFYKNRYNKIKLWSDFYKTPICLCYYKDGEYRLVDGYHRLAAANEGKINIFVAE